ncbi:hypothetical protein GCM10022238_26240 [Gordonia hankookensis]
MCVANWYEWATDIAAELSLMSGFVSPYRRLAVAAAIGVIGATFVACGSSDGMPGTTSASNSAVATSPTPTVVVLDASDSMNTDDAPGLRIDAAKSAVTALVDSLPDTAKIGVTVFGGSVPSERGPRRGCTDVQTVSQLAALDTRDPRPEIAAVTAQGWSPVGGALLAAAQPLAGAEGAIVLVSDGEATCPPDPCVTAEQIRSANPEITISAIGLKTDSEQLRCIANAGGGVFVTADNTEQLTARLSTVQSVDAAESLSAEGLYGISLGESLGDIQKSHADFPSGGGAAVVEWRECRWHFEGGTLTQIEPINDTVTIDGVRRGTPMSRLVELFGAPIQVDETVKRAYFTANEALGTAFVVDYDGDTSNGTVRAISLCKCLPEQKTPELTAPVQEKNCGPTAAFPKLRVISSGVSCQEGLRLIERYVADPRTQAGDRGAQVGEWACNIFGAAQTDAGEPVVKCERPDGATVDVRAPRAPG